MSTKCLLLNRLLRLVVMHLQRRELFVVISCYVGMILFRIENWYSYSLQVSGPQVQLLKNVTCKISKYSNYQVMEIFRNCLQQYMEDTGRHLEYVILKIKWIQYILLFKLQWNILLIEFTLEYSSTSKIFLSLPVKPRGLLFHDDCKIRCRCEDRCFSIRPG